MIDFRLLLPALCLTAVGRPADLPQSAADLLRRQGFTDDEIASVARGKRIVRALPTESAEQVAFAGAVRLPVSRSAYLARLRSGTLYRSGGNILQIGRFSERPGVSDLRDFHLEDPGGRQRLIRSIAEFEKDGTMTAGRLDEQPRAIDRRLHFEPLARQAATLRERQPRAYEYLLRYPNAQPLGADDFYMWTELTFGLSPVVRVAQVSIWDTPAESVVLTRQIYATQYFEVSFQIDCLIEDGPSVYLITLNYGRSELLKGVTGKLIRPIVVARTLALAEKTLDRAARELRARS